ncbi:hypothetical protein NDU88_004180 [Pleurodeles waltl]|uniref:Uncharacterized protein n=1 Tax=Pleurodeles waltl TaxID=8319 RepID=A0AAV7VI03_PLEWA|nr:hypothetical protein NDU88_004180 [Pleurodeles waltl]
MATGVRQKRKGTEGRRSVEANKHKTRKKPWRLDEKKIRRRTVAWRFHLTKEGEDAQRPATFWKERGQFRRTTMERKPAGKCGNGGVLNPVSIANRCAAGEEGNRGTVTCGGKQARDENETLEARREDDPEEDGGPEVSSD